ATARYVRGSPQSIRLRKKLQTEGTRLLVGIAFFGGAVYSGPKGASAVGQTSPQWFSVVLGKPTRGIQTRHGEENRICPLPKSVGQGAVSLPIISIRLKSLNPPDGGHSFEAPFAALRGHVCRARTRLDSAREAVARPAVAVPLFGAQRAVVD